MAHEANPQISIPTATYRLQFNRDFTFDDAEAVAPYLADLGISHCYSSPYLKARPGSTHGYDIVDHQALNPEIGDIHSYRRLIAALHRHGLGQVLDVVPNHMAVGGDDNRWWLDVMENGPASPFADYFDIDWQPAAGHLRGKVLLPLLGDHYGTVLGRGDIQLRFDHEHGEFSAWYFNHRCPLDPRSYPMILCLCNAESRQGFLEEMIERCRSMPTRYAGDPLLRAHRRAESAAVKCALAAWYRDDFAALACIREALEHLNGMPGRDGSFNRLHELLEEQGYRLAYWRVAADEINYRRFFDINDLAGLRMENPAVFDATHAFIFRLIAEGAVDGLRIDHPDGLYDPREYVQRLQQRAAEVLRRQPPGDDAPLPLYVVVEKILASYEFLPSDWPVHGTTGYDFANQLNGLFIRPETERRLLAIFARYEGRRDFDDLLYERKKLIIRVQLSSELTVLTNLLNTLSEQDRHTRDFTRFGLRDALAEIVACFPVYRTYINSRGVSAEDRRYIEWAVAQAKKRSPAADVSIFDFVSDVLLLKDAASQPRALHFVMKLQQYTAPVTAKALEDTVFYNYNPLLSLNEVGGDPRRFGVTVKAFHHLNQERQRRWPHALIATSTHDSKRSEDVKARLNVLSEIPREWNTHVTRWFRLNRTKRREWDGGIVVPAPGDEYFLYQTLLGVWPLEALDEDGLAALRKRVQSYLLKAIREAKTYTSWVNPNSDYEQGIHQFIEALLAAGDNNAFLADFLPFQQRVAGLALYTSLSQVLLKCTSPGVPDIYQGQELWDFRLVDPDNRRPVDYRRRAMLLRELTAEMNEAQPELARRARALVDSIADGRAKLYVTWRCLNLRRRRADHFRHGEYLPLAVRGPHQDFVCAHAWRHNGRLIVAAAPRWVASLLLEGVSTPLGEAAWADTFIYLPAGTGGSDFHNLLTGETLSSLACPEVEACTESLHAADAFRSFPVALLVSGARQPL